MKEAKIEKIVVHTGRKRIELTLEEVKELERIFSDIRGRNITYVPYYYYPCQYYYYWYDEYASRITYSGTAGINTAVK